MQNPTQKFRQGSIVFEEADISSKKVKMLTSSNYILNSFCWNFAQVFYLQCVQRVFEICFILSRSWVIFQNNKRSDFYTLKEKVYQ